MTKRKIVISFAVIVVVFAALFTIYKDNLAHCDTLDGPVVKAAQESLETGNVNLILIWVQKEDEAKVIQAYNETVKSRDTSPEQKEAIESKFFETVVRLHREGEGEPFTGLKAAGTDLGLAIPAGDKAIEDGSTAKLEDLLVETLRDGLKDKFTEVREKMKYDKDNVDAGREYVKAYVEYIHYVENLYNAAGSKGHAHSESKTEEHKCEHNCGK